MNKLVLLLVVIIAATGCKKDFSRDDLAKINGYWEIKKVVSPEGEPKDYTFNETFDYYRITDLQGTRTKVRPQLDGSFLDANLTETFVIAINDGELFVNYKTPFAKWTEQVISLSDSAMVVVNADKKEFHYKKTGPINLTGNGKATK